MKPRYRKTSGHSLVVDIEAVLLDEVRRLGGVAEHQDPNDVLEWKGDGSRTHGVGVVQRLQGPHSDLHGKKHIRSNHRERCKT